MAVEGHVHHEHAVENVLFVQLLGDGLDTVGIAGKGDHFGTVDGTDGDFPFVAFGKLFRLFVGEADREHAAFVRGLELDAAPVEDEEDGLFEGQCS